ncbi:glycosyltransferase [Lacisediminihabitans sp.]|uniref:glycosyltransferase n=1 Tax=Lacisediminihabitans sp. TaxID=2787631 RepID=UPI00374DAD70
MRKGIDHVILTRFNLPSVGVESLVRAQEGWLRTRVALFEKYCVPSVLGQTSSNFRWLIYLDPESPEWLRGLVADYERAGTFVPIYRESVSPSELLDDIRALTGAGGSTLITSNLDNDDALAVDFVQRLQDTAPAVPRAALYFSHGLIKSPAGLYFRTDRHNAFCSVRETWEAPDTCWVDWHDRLPRRMPVQLIGGEPGWLQVVHGTNVSNRVRGSLTSPDRYRTLFPTLLDDVPPPRAADITRDRLVAAPLRVTRESARSLVKHVAIALLGKSGFDSAKGALARARRSAARDQPSSTSGR